MLVGKITVKIEKDNNIAKYIKIIRNYDRSLPLGQVKKAIETGDVVFSFDSDNNPLISNGIDSSDRFLSYYFLKTLKELKKSGAKMIVYNETFDHYEEFTTSKGSGDNISQGTTDPSVMSMIEQKWKLPQKYIEFLKTHPNTQEIEIEDEDTFDTIIITLYGANDLIRFQEGYSYNPVEKVVIEDWDSDLIVIADSEADPFCLDLSKNNSPVLHALHGMDEWDFDEYCDSLDDFFEMLNV